MATTASSSPPAQTAGAPIRRTFRLVPYGSDAPPDVSTISCDGRVKGTDLELTHWTKNETPDSLYADTSTEIALNFARARLEDDGKYAELDEAVVLNNHYDTDGVLSSWTCLVDEPQIALDHADLLVSGAEAGDFGEWNSDEGVKLDCALSALLAANEEEEEVAYAKAFEVLPSLLKDLERTGGEKYKELWEKEWADVCTDWSNLEHGKASVSEGLGRIALATEEEGKKNNGMMSPYALHRGIRGLTPAQPFTRVLRAKSDGEGRWKFRYEKPGHGWVDRLVRRPEISSVDGNDLSHKLNELFGLRPGIASWVGGGAGGLVGICHTAEFVETDPSAVLEALIELDESAAA